jgi:biotin carboxylase
MRWCTIVDAYSSGTLLAPEFRRKGRKTVHVKSGTAPTHLQRTYLGTDFDLEVDTSKNLVDLLRRLEPECVVPGCETGVALADYLANALQVETRNPLETTVCRRNKYEMIRRVSADGLLAPRQFASRSADECIAWAVEQRFPVVVKPLDSFGANRVAVCRSPDEVRMAAEHVIGKANLLGGTDIQVLVQTRLVGHEYEVNLVGRAGRFVATDIWHYDKPILESGEVIYQEGWLIDREGATQNELVAYAEKVATSLGILNGPCHIEIMLTSQGPALIEAGARLCGGGAPAVCAECIGEGQHEVTVEALLEPAAFEKRLGKFYKLSKECCNVHLICPRDNSAIRSDVLSQLKALHTAFAVRLNSPVGQPLRRTVDLSSSPGTFRLIGNRAEIAHDLTEIRNLETTALYA